jgi:hypothetical protein
LELLDKTEVTGDVVSILLLQIVPGKEKDAVAQLQENSHVYKGLGKYDLIALTEEDGFQFSDEKKSFLNNIRGNLPPGTLDWMTLCAFRVILSRSEPKQIQGKNVLGVCCIKLKLENEVRSLETEQNLIVRLLNAMENINVFSGLGYHEIICLVERETVDELSSAINSIKELSMQDGSSLILDINTIPSVKFECLEKPDSIKGNISATIMINLKTGAPTKIGPLLEKYLGNSGELIFGFHDVIIDVNSQTDSFLKNLIKLREELAQWGLYSSCTLIRHKDNEVDIKPCSPWTPIKEEIETIDYSQMPPDLVYYHDLYKVLRNDPFTRSLLLNLHHVIGVLNQDYNEALNNLSQGQINSYKEAMDTYYSILSVINSYLRQRLSGVHVGNLLGAKGVSFEIIGGIQRLLYALEAGSSFLIASLGLKWDGFAIYGHYHSFRSWFSHEIVAMPSKYLLKPEFIWGMNHETGHIVFLKLLKTDAAFESSINSLYEKAKEDIKTRLTKEKEKIPSDERIFDFVYQHFSDFYSDFFDFSYGFKGNWELYKNTLWAFLRSFGPNNPTYVARTYLVYMILGPGAGKSSELATELFFKELKEFFPEYRETHETIRKESLNLANRFFEASVFLGDGMKKYLSKLDRNQIDEEITKTRKALLDGHFVINSDPTLIVQSLLTLGNVPRARFSAILSLYNSGCIPYLKSQ